MRSFIFECVWENPAAPEVALVKEMWRRFQAIDSDEMIERRAGQIVLVIKNDRGEVGGVSTVRPLRATFLNNHFFYEFRCFIAPPFRAAGLDSQLVIRTKQFLEQQPGSPAKFKGLLMVVESEALKVQRTKAVWPAGDMVFAGYDARGNHIRVGYFKGARI